MQKISTAESENSFWNTYCELGAFSSNEERIVHDRLEGNEAYDHFAVALYLKQALAFKNLRNQKKVTLEQIPRKEKILFLYEILRFFNFKKTYFEIGASVFEVIDGLELINDLVHQSVNLKSLRFEGIEISKVMRETAMALHPHHKIKFIDNFDEMPEGCVLYDRIVSSYCFKNTTELAKVMNKARLSFSNLYLSKSHTKTIINDVAKPMTYFSQSNLVEFLDKPLYYLFGREKEGSREGFFLNCRSEDLEGLMNCFSQNPYLNEFMTEKKLHPQLI